MQPQKSGFSIDRAVFALAGFFVLTSLALGYWVTPWAYLFTAMIGLNMFQAAFTGVCPAAWVFGKIGLSAGPAFPCSR